MVITISNLPPHVTEEQIIELLQGDSRIQRITLNNEGNPDKVMAFVEIDVSRLEAQFLANKLNHAYFEERHLDAYTPLFMGR